MGKVLKFPTSKWQHTGPVDDNPWTHGEELQKFEANAVKIIIESSEPDDVQPLLTETEWRLLYEQAEREEAEADKPERGGFWLWVACILFLTW
jgi:hypothetical protein